jgi:CubicO group peptidase (beta-lactamase class C family)
MVDRLRRAFLIEAGMAALGVSLPAAAVRAGQDAQDAGDAKRRPAWDASIGTLERQIAELMRKTSLPGLSMAIIRDGTLAWRRAFGVRDSTSKRPVDVDTLFNAGSMSKPVFAYLVLKLCEKGVLNLDTPLTRYTTARYLEGDARLDVITARHVLSHTSGFQNWRSTEEPLKIHFTPGEKYLYSGEGYSYLQSVVTHLAGRANPNDCGTYEAGVKFCATDIDTYIKANLLVPFGMTRSGYVWTEAYEKHAARPHDGDGRPLEETGKPSAREASRYAAAGLLHTTPTEFARFMIEILDPRPSDAFRLKRESVAEMLRPQVKTNDEFASSWALGWQVQQGGVINHGGDNKGWHAHAVASPERKSGFVIMTNGDGGHELLRTLLLGNLMAPFL